MQEVFIGREQTIKDYLASCDFDMAKLCAQTRASSLAGGMPVW